MEVKVKNLNGEWNDSNDNNNNSTPNDRRCINNEIEKVNGVATSRIIGGRSGEESIWKRELSS